jgi:hypothetical protein
MIELGFLIALHAIIGGFDSHMVHQVMRVWCLTASTTVFQTDSNGSNPFIRSMFYTRLTRVVRDYPYKIDYVGSIPTSCTKFCPVRIMAITPVL